MIKTLLSVASHRVIIDARTNQVSIIDVFDGFKSQSFPIVLPKMVFLFNLQKDKGDKDDYNMKLCCYINDEEIIKAPVAINFNKSDTTRAIIDFSGFVIPKPGDLITKLLGEDDSVLGMLTFPIGKIEISKPKVKVE